MKRAGSKEESGSPSELIDGRIAELGDWRGETLAKVRALIKEADPAIVEEWKWRIPVWSHDGIVCTGETYKSAVKLTFAKGAAVDDPSGLFNSSLEGNVRRAIDIHEGEKLKTTALKALIRAAAALNSSGKKKPAATKSSATKSSATKSSATKSAAAKSSATKSSATKSSANKSATKKPATKKPAAPRR